MEKVFVDLGKNSYEISIGKGILKEISSHIKSGRRVAVISNDTVGKLYGEQVVNFVKEKTDNVFYYEIKDGEEYKSIETALPIYDFLIDHNFDRSSLLISLGGGVVCDLTGYIAATFMRGIDFIQIPTSLLAQVDASIGGKVAINHPKGKNIIGSFYQPKHVLIDIDVLKTLHMREIKTGIAEIIKHGVIRDSYYFDYLYKNSKAILALESEAIIKTIKRSCEIKAEIVALDETEQSVRALLNYGHTFGHVVESLTKYKIYQHGEAIVSGMTLAAEIAFELKMIDKEFLLKQEKIFELYGIDYQIPKYSFSKVAEILKHDKKVKDGNLIFVLPTKIGEAVTKKIDENCVKNVYEKCAVKNVKGVIDIGTNTTRLFIGEIIDNKIINKYFKRTEITKLGEDVDKNRYLLDTAIDRTIGILKKYKEIADSYGVISLQAYATSASRDASNGGEFIKKAKEIADVDIEIISGEEEGKSAFKGVTTDNYSGKICVIDIGGGSTEFIYGDNAGIEFIKSLNMGAVRVKEKFFKDDVYSKENYDKCKKWIYEHLEKISNLKEFDFSLIGVAGTVTTQVSVLKKMEKYISEEVHKFELSIEDIKKNLFEFENKSLEERIEIVGLEPKRADVIVSGTFLLITIMEYFHKTKIIVSEADILEGLIIRQ